MLHNELVITSALWRLSFSSSSLGVMMASAHCVDRVELWQVLGVGTLAWRSLDWCTSVRRVLSSRTFVQRFLDLCTLVLYVWSSCTLVRRFSFILLLLIEPVESHGFLGLPSLLQRDFCLCLLHLALYLLRRQLVDRC